jgi:hypothetical protein
MKQDNVRPFLLSACFLLLVALIAITLSGCNSECGNGLGSCIEIGEEPAEPDVCFVEDECVDTVVDEFCEVTECEDRFAEGYRAGFTAAQEQDTHECPEPDVVEPGDDGYCDLSVPVGHRPIECRGRDHGTP